MSRSRRRTLAFTSIAVVCLAAVWYGTPLHERHKGVLRAGIRNQILSSNLNPEGRVDGLAVEILKEAARRRNVKLEWINCPEGPDAAMRANKIDLWPITQDLPERRKHFHITAPWLAAERCLITKGPPPGVWKGERVIYGLGPESQLLAATPGAIPVHVPGDLAAVAAVCAGDARAAFIVMQSLGAFVLKKPAGCEKSDFRVTPVHGKSLKLGIGSTFEAADDADALRLEVGRMAAEGALEQLFNKYSLYSIAETADIYELMEAQSRARAVELGGLGMIVALGILAWQVKRVREARRAAEKANNAKTEFLANMSHEIRTPLNGIVALTEVLGRTGLSTEQRDLTAIVMSSAESLMNIVNDILDFSKIESGGMTMEHIDFDIRSAVEEAVLLFTPRARQKGLEINFHLASAVPRMITADPIRIRQVLMNLLANAIKFTDTGGISIEVDRTGSADTGPALLFRVTDTGIGIAPEVSAKLFRAFTQADSTTTRKFGGTGLGLAISLRLVTLMGGSIGLESEPGKGSTFWFIIPAPSPTEASAPLPAMTYRPAVFGQPAPVAPAKFAQPAARTASDCRILVVDDNPVNQLVAVRALRTLGYEPDVVASGEAALDALTHSNYDLILMDCQMPGMDGYAATAEIRRRETGRRRTPIVAMTANAIDGDRERCAAAGMDDYLSKPFRIALLERTLQRWLSGKLEPSVA
jgi:signal transduction histidine kinase/CheY-like chemotaxis protein